jgi:hypothetical protein
MKFSRKQLVAIAFVYSLSTAIITELILNVFNLGGNNVVLIYFGVTAVIIFAAPPRRVFGKIKK